MSIRLNLLIFYTCFDMKADPSGKGEGPNLIYTDLLDKFEGAKSNAGTPYFKKQYELVVKFLNCEKQS